MKFKGFYAELSELIGVENMLTLYKHYKGQQVNFPSVLYDKQYIKNKISEEYDGTNIKFLSKKYGYSERWIYHILTEKQVDK